MISSIQWIPKGAANPRPKRFELSKREMGYVEGDGDRPSFPPSTMDDDNSENKDGVITDRDETNSDDGSSTKKKLTATEIIASRLIDPSSLSSDLRMDEYSDDDDEDENNDGIKGNKGASAAVLGKLLIGQDDLVPNEDGSIDEDDIDVDVDEEIVSMEDGEAGDGNYDSDDDSDDDENFDNLEDIPDTREFVPTNLEGMESMNLGGGDGGGGGQSGIEHEERPEDDDSDSDDDGGSDVEDTNIRSDDALIVIAKAEEDFASLEIHVYEEKSGNLYVHHDLPLPTYPLCLAHGGNGAVGGNYVAVGTFDPAIEIWNLDVLDVLEPTFVLGGSADASAADAEWVRLMEERDQPSSTTVGGKKKKKGKKKGNGGVRSGGNAIGGGGGKGGLVNGSHSDAVTCLSWNPVHGRVIASGSADRAVKLWDVTRHGDNGSSGSPPVATLDHHSAAIVALEWHPSEVAVLASGGSDNRICVLDTRAAGGLCAGVDVRVECEALAWDPHNPHLLTASDEGGIVTCWDVRTFGGTNTGGVGNGPSPLWSMVAHQSGACTDLSYNANVPGMLATCCVDGTVALWDSNISGNNNDKKPYKCGGREMQVGRLHTISLHPSSTWLLATGGTGNEIAVWDLAHEESVRNRFKEQEGKGYAANGTIAGEEGEKVNQAETEVSIVRVDEVKDKSDIETEMTMEMTPQLSETKASSKKKKKKKKKNKPKAHKK